MQRIEAYAIDELRRPLDVPDGQIAPLAGFQRAGLSGEAEGPGRLKPWPDGYLLAAERLGIHPGECLVVGDRADADGEAARRGGMAFRRVG